MNLSIKGKKQKFNVVFVCGDSSCILLSRSVELGFTAQADYGSM